MSVRLRLVRLVAIAAVQLKRCLVDGLDTPVVAAPSAAVAAGQG